MLACCQGNKDVVQLCPNHSSKCVELNADRLLLCLLVTKGHKMLFTNYSKIDLNVLDDLDDLDILINSIYGCLSKVTRRCCSVAYQLLRNCFERQR